MQICIIVAIIFIVALAMVLQIDDDGQIYYSKPSKRKVEEVKIKLSAVDKLVDDFVVKNELKNQLQGWLCQNSHCEKKCTIPVHIPYSISNRITLLSDKEEQEFYERLKKMMSLFHMSCICLDTKSLLFVNAYYIVTGISFRNKMKGPYTILDVEVELDKTS
jgi:hypothetical protein